MITIDSKEASKKPKIVAGLKAAGRQVEIAPLEVGDYVDNGLEMSVVAERKTPADLILSSFGNRLWEQLKGLADSREQGYKPYLILEGNFIFDSQLRKPVTVSTYFNRHAEKKASWHMLLWSIGKFGIKILPTTDENGTIIMLAGIDKEIGEPKEKKDYPLRGGFKKDWSLETKKLYLLEAFGKETAKALMDYQPKIAQLVADIGFDATRAEIHGAERIIAIIADMKMKSGRRIGEKKAEEIYGVLFQ